MMVHAIVSIIVQPSIIHMKISKIKYIMYKVQDYDSMFFRTIRLIQ